MTNTTNKILFYLRNTDRHPFGAVAMEFVNTTSNKDGGERVYVAASACHPKDPWDTGTARRKTLGRLESPSHRIELTMKEVEEYLWPHIGFSLNSVLRQLGISQGSHPDADLEANQRVFARELQFLIDKNVPDGSVQ